MTPGRSSTSRPALTKTWQRPPTDAELKGLIDDWVREEIATREALALGLDKDDTRHPAPPAAEAGVRLG